MKCNCTSHHTCSFHRRQIETALDQISKIQVNDHGRASKD